MFVALLLLPRVLRWSAAPVCLLASLPPGECGSMTLPNGLCVTANGTDHWHESFIRKEQTGEAVIEQYLPPLSFTRLLSLVAKVEEALAGYLRPTTDHG